MKKSSNIKILFLSDTHLGFDDPVKPRIERRRRGDDFYQHFIDALQPAFQQQVDFVVHGGDLFYRSKIPDSLITKAFTPLLQIAECGMPVILVPGNHERGNIRQNLFDYHKNIHIFNEAKTISIEVKGQRICLSGFPHFRGNVRQEFSSIAKKTSYDEQEGDINLLCVHHAFSGAQVGVQNFTFTNKEDVINPKNIPEHFHAVLSGHIHRHQTLWKGDIPIIYPGATTRTAFAERREEKGYTIITINKTDSVNIAIDFIPLKSRKMIILNQSEPSSSKTELLQRFKNQIQNLPDDAIIKIKFLPDDPIAQTISASELRKIAGANRNLEF